MYPNDLQPTLTILHHGEKQNAYEKISKYTTEMSKHTTQRA